jgi:CBS domain containing-hemolysin-like protein
MEDIIEELVGEIQDEHDEEKPTVEKKSETEYIINAHSSISDVNESLPMALPENPKYETVSGLINFLWGRIPAVNEKRHYDGYEITILQRKKQTVELVKLRVLDADKVQ